MMVGLLPKHLFTELHRRRVLRVGGAYIAIAWLVTEIASFLLEQAGAPAWSLRVLSIAFIVGFPVAVVLAWVIERDAEGKWRIDTSEGQLKTVLSAVVLGIAATALFSWLILPRMATTTAEPDYQPLPHSLAILPLRTATGTPAEKSSVDTLVGALMEGLDRSGQMVIFDLSNLPVIPEDPVAFGRGFRAAALLSGQLIHSGDGVTMEIQMLDLASMNNHWSRAIHWDTTRIGEIGTDIANGVLGSMGLPSLSYESFTGTDVREAWEALLRAGEHQKSFKIDGLRKAMEDYQRAIDLDPDYVRAYLAYANTIRLYQRLKGPAQEEAQGLEQRVRELVETAYELEKDLAETNSLMGLLTENLELRIRFLERALELDPNHAVSYFRLGHARAEEGNLPEAERLVRRALEFEPRNANYRSDLGSLLWEMGRRDEAMAEIERAIALDPEDFQNYLKLGQWAMFHHGRIDEAIISFRKAYSLNPEHGYLASGLAVNYGHLSMWPEAIAWANRAIEISPAHGWNWLLSALPYLASGDEKTAMDRYRKSLELNPRLGIPLRILGSYDIRNGGWQEARERWKNAYPELVDIDEPVLNRGNSQAAHFYALNLEEAGLLNADHPLVKALYEFEFQEPFEPDSDAVKSWIRSILEPTNDELLAGLRAQIVDNGQRIELQLSSSVYDPVREDPEFQALVRIVENDLGPQRQRLIEMERNGELAPAPGVGPGL